MEKEVPWVLDEQQLSSSGMPDETTVDEAWARFLESAEEHGPDEEEVLIPRTNQRAIIHAPVAGRIALRMVKTNRHY